jgi:phenylalanine-4-hydroxylase
MTLDQRDLLKMVAEKSDGAVLRGNYAVADAHYVVAQNWSGYTSAQHALWRRLYERQTKLLPGLAYGEFIDHLAKLGVADGIPPFDRISESLSKATGWRLVAVPGLVPDKIFFEHLANRRFPVTVWLREPHEFEFCIEPDIFHDVFGHVPMLFNQVFADHLEEYGKRGLNALRLEGLEFLARLYWYTVEFGLIQTPQGLRVYGAAILSSGGEIQHCLTSSQPHRIPFSAERVMRTLYKIDSYQKTYFVIRDFRQLLEATALDFAPIFKRLKLMEALPANSLLPDEINLSAA